MRLSREKVSRLTGLSPNALNWLAIRGKLPSSGQMTLTQVLAVAAGKALKAAGVAEPEVRRAVGTIWVTNQEELEHRFASGQSRLLILGSLVLPHLLSEEACRNPAGVDLAQWELLSGTRPRTLDLKLIWDALLVEAAKIDEPKGEASRGTHVHVARQHQPGEGRQKPCPPSAERTQGGADEEGTRPPSPRRR